MIIVLFVLTIVFLLFIKAERMDKPSKIMLSFIVGFWLFALFVPMTGYVNIYRPHDYTYFLLILNVFFFILGFTFIKIRKCPVSLQDSISSEIKGLIRKRWVWVVAIIVALYVLSKIVIFWNSLSTYSTLRELREDYFSGLIYGPEFPYVNMFFLGNFSCFFLPLFCYLLIRFKINLRMLLISGIATVGYIILSGGRFGYFYVFINILTLELVLGLSNYNKKKIISIVSLFAVLLFVVLVYVSNAQKGNYDNEGNNDFSGGRESTVESIVLYSCGGVVAFDQVVNKNYKEKIGGFQYGRLTLSAVDMFVDILTNRFLGQSINPSLKKISFKQDDVIMIGPDKSWNALYTACLFYYLDFGLIGCIIFPYIMGLLLRFLIKCLYKFPTYSMIVLVCYILRCAIFSAIDYSLAAPFLGLFLVLMYIDWCKKYQKKRKLKSVYSAPRI